MGKRINNIVFYVFIAFQISFKKKMNLLEKMNGLVASVSGEAVRKQTKEPTVEKIKKTCRISGQTNGNMLFRTTDGEIASVRVRRGAKFENNILYVHSIE